MAFDFPWWATTVGVYSGGLVPSSLIRNRTLRADIRVVILGDL